MWSNRDWLGSLYPARANSKTYLRYYSGVFNTVEGNTTFYALPSEDVVASWKEQVQENFRFSFKLPRAVTHERSLRHSGSDLIAFFERLEPLAANMGSFMVQLPASFSPEQLDDLERFLGILPAEYRYAVEVRHPDFFRRDENEKALNQLLKKHCVDRVCFDSRALFSQPAVSEAEIDAHRKKPRLPVHALVTGSQPLVRFIGTANLQYNQQYLLPWVQKITEWVAEGLRPYVFIHTPDNGEAPLQADQFHQLLSKLPGWQPLPKLASSTQASFF